MSIAPILRILARVADARRPDRAHHLRRRRPPLPEPKEPERSSRSNRCLVRQVFEVTTADFARSSADEWDNMIPYDRNQPA